MTEFFLYTLWIIILAVMVNIIMEKVWHHTSMRAMGENETEVNTTLMGRHRA